jgi:hypothetical protein
LHPPFLRLLRPMLNALACSRLTLSGDAFARFLAPNNASLLYVVLFVSFNLLLVWP